MIDSPLGLLVLLVCVCIYVFGVSIGKSLKNNITNFNLSELCFSCRWEPNKISYESIKSKIFLFFYFIMMQACSTLLR